MVGDLIVYNQKAWKTTLFLSFFIILNLDESLGNLIFVIFASR